MPRYIDAEQLKNYIQDTTASFSSLTQQPEHIVTKAYLLAIKHVIQHIDHAPTADVVEVVRCKDCRNRIEKNWAKCHGRNPNDFCSYGERKEKWEND